MALGVFLILVMSATGIYNSVIQGQRSAVSSQITQESMRYMFEVMSKEIRQAKENNSVCLYGSTNYSTYNIDSYEDAKRLIFKNRDDLCVEYYLKDGILVKSLDGFAASTTPDEIFISDLAFSVHDHDWEADPDNKINPSVTISMTVEMRAGKKVDKNKFIIQTTVSSRYYRY